MEGTPHCSCPVTPNQKTVISTEAAHSPHREQRSGEICFSTHTSTPHDAAPLQFAAILT
jgi:hypothetical protein